MTCPGRRTGKGQPELPPTHRQGNPEGHRGWVLSRGPRASVSPWAPRGAGSRGINPSCFKGTTNSCSIGMRSGRQCVLWPGLASRQERDGWGRGRRSSSRAASHTHRANSHVHAEGGASPSQSRGGARALTPPSEPWIKLSLSPDLTAWSVPESISGPFGPGWFELCFDISSQEGPDEPSKGLLHPKVIT